jgi:hypothetical protein
MGTTTATCDRGRCQACRGADRAVNPVRFIPSILRARAGFEAEISAAAGLPAGDMPVSEPQHREAEQ